MPVITSSQPVMPPPAGVTSNFDNPVSRAQVEIICSVICPLVAFLFVSMRMASKMMTRSLGWDDYSSVAAMATSISYSTILLVRIKYGFTRHMWDVPLTSWVPYLLQYIMASAVLYGFVLLFAKLSILFLYTRLFKVHRLFIYLTYGLIFVVSTYLIGSIGVAIFQCMPVQKAWDPALPGKCVEVQNVAIFAAVMNVVTDFAIFLLPLPLVWSLRMERRAKIGLWMVFLAGALVCICSIIRLHATIDVAGDMDITWTWVNWDIASLVEGNVGIICGCMPAIKPMLQRFLPSMLPPSIMGSERSKVMSPPPFSTSSMGRDGAQSRLDGPYYPLEEPKRMKSPFFRDGADAEEVALESSRGGTVRPFQVPRAGTPTKSIISYPKPIPEPQLTTPSGTVKAIGIALTSADDDVENRI